jgi:hypothetical protein
MWRWSRWSNTSPICTTLGALAQFAGTGSRRLISLYARHGSTAWQAGYGRVSLRPTSRACSMIQYSDEGGEVAFEVPPAELDCRRAWSSWPAATPSVDGSVTRAAGGLRSTSSRSRQWNPDKVVVIAYQADAARSRCRTAQGRPGVAGADRSRRAARSTASPPTIFGWDSPDPRWILGLQWLAAKIAPGPVRRPRHPGKRCDSFFS